MPDLVQAAVWGLLAGSGLLIGAVVAVGFGGRLSHRINATGMGFGGGVLIVVLSIDLIEPAFRDGGPMAATLGFLFGATMFCAINWRLAQQGARHRNRCGECAEHRQRRITGAADWRSRSAPSLTVFRSPS